MSDDIAVAFWAGQVDREALSLGFGGCLGACRRDFLPLLTSLRPLLTLFGLIRSGSRLGGDQVEQRFFQQFTGDDQRVGLVSGELDVTVKGTAVGSAHADVAANPCWEKEETTVKQMPFRCPGQGDVIHAERFDLGRQPSKNTDDKDHGEHHGLHGAHLDLQLFRHHLLLKRHGFLLEDGVAGKTGLVHDLTNLALAMPDVGLVHRVNKEISNHRVQGH